MIIWINGAFGSGKTTTALKLHEKLENSYIYDPENVGYFLWQNEPEQVKVKEDFQIEPLWREFNYMMLKNIYEKYDGDIIVPMTLVNHEYYNEIVGRLKNDGVDVLHFVIYASKETLLKRLAERGDNENSWPAAQIDRCVAVFDSGAFDGVIKTDNKSTDEIVNHIMEVMYERTAHTS